MYMYRFSAAIGPAITLKHLRSFYRPFIPQIDDVAENALTKNMQDSACYAEALYGSLPYLVRGGWQ